MHENACFITTDKDISRRNIESIPGALFRTFENFCMDNRFYKFRANISPEEAVKIKEKAAHKLLPKHWKKDREFSVQNLPSVRLLRKAKCVNRNGSGLACGKDHAHNREIIDCS